MTGALPRLPSGKATVAGVIGWPVGHSRSPRLHGHWLYRYGIDGLYAPFPVHPDRLDSAVRGLAAAGLAGLNVTIPHKEAVFRLCDSLDDRAAQLEAVNTLIFHEDGRIEGRNTDGYGFAQNLAAGATVSTEGTAVVLGAGGAARAVTLALRDMGFRHTRLTNRTRARAEAIAARQDGIDVVDWDERHAALAGATLLVNTTALGMAGQPPLDLALDDLPPAAVVNDIVYTPLETPLLAAARTRGNPVVDGLGMLLHQGRPGFHAWFGVDPAVDDALRRAVAADLLPDGAARGENGAP